MITCEVCGQTLPDGTAFCSNCGSPLENAPMIKPDSDAIASAIPDQAVTPTPEQASAAPVPEMFTSYDTPQQSGSYGQLTQQSKQVTEENPYAMPETQYTQQTTQYGQTQYTNQPGYGQPQYTPYYQPPYGQPVNNYYVQPKQTNGKSVASLIMGILSLLLLCAYGGGIPFGIMGIVFGVIAKKEIQNDSTNTKGGSGMATGGIVCSVIGLVLSVLFLLIIIIVAFLLGTDPYYSHQDFY